MSADVEVYESVEPLASEWDALASRVDAPPFQRPGWVGATLAAGSQAVELVAIRRNGRLAGVVPLHRWPGSRQAMTNWMSPEVGFLAEDASAARDLASAVIGRGHRSLSLYFVDSLAYGPEEIQAAAQAGGYRLLDAVKVPVCPYLLIDGDWETYERSLSGNLRGDVGRRWRRIEAEGNATVEIGDGGPDLDAALDAAFRLEALGWKGAEGKAVICSPDRLGFYRRASRWAAERGWLRLASLRLDGRTLAFALFLEQGTGVYWLESGYDPAFERLSPGKLVIHAVLRRAFSHGFKRFEFGGGTEFFKLQWTLGRHKELTLLRAFAPSTAGFAEWALYAHARPATRRVARFLKGGRTIAH